MTIAKADFASFSFFTSLGASVHWDRHARFERDAANNLSKLTHAIRLTGIIIPSPSATTDAQKQDSLNERRNLLIAALTAGPQRLRIFDNDGTTVAIQYGGADPTGSSTHAEWHPTRDELGCFVTNYHFPDQRDGTLHVNYQEYTIDLEAEVEAECDAEGIQSYTWRETASYTNGILDSLSYSAVVITCSGTDCSDVVPDLLDELRDDAAALFAAFGLTIGEERHTETEIKDVSNRCEFQITFQQGEDASGTSADSIRPTANLTIIGNRVVLTVSAIYKWSGGRRRSVLEEAKRLDGVNVDNYLPTGCVKLVHSETRMSFNEASREITASQTIIGHYKHSTILVTLHETIHISRQMPVVSDNIHAWLLTDTSPPMCSLHVGGLGPIIITITTTIEAVQAWMTLPPRFVEDYFNGPIQVQGTDVQGETRTPDVEGVLTQQGLYRSSFTQVWKHADIGTLPVPIPIASIFQQSATPISGFA